MAALTAVEHTVLAAVFGGTNAGMAKPERDAVQHLLQPRRGGRPVDLDAAVHALWSGYMESTAIQRMFMDEAKAWHRQLTMPKYTREEITRVWPDHAALVWAA